MEKGLYIYSGAKNSFSGVEKKIRNQIKVFSNSYEMSEIKVEKESTNVIKSILWRFPGGSFGQEYDKALDEVLEMKDLKFIYIRDSFWDKRRYNFIKSIKDNLKSTKVILELPAYPYSNELIHSVSMWPFYFKDKHYRKFTEKVADRIVTYSDDDFIYDVPTIKTMNGIIVDEMSYKKSSSDECIDLIAVASMQKHHGYERVIKGLGTYYNNGGTRKIKLHLVGNGPQNSYYEKLTDDLGIKDYVKFWGNKSGKELDQLFEMADIGLGSLGFHLIGAEKTVSSTLKTREYLAHGLPFVSACAEDVFLKHPESKFFMRFPDDDSEIPIDRVVDFYDELVKEYGEIALREEVHKFAKQTIDMTSVMQPIIDYIDKE